MAVVLSNIQQRVERSIYKTLEFVTNDVGYGLIKADYANTVDGLADYTSDLQDIINNKGFAIEIFGASGTHAKGAKEVARIVILPDAIVTGDLGTPPGAQIGVFDELNDQYPIVTKSPTTSDLHYEIRTVYNNIAQDRIMNAIIGYTLGTRKYLTFHDAAEKFFIERLGSTSFPDSNYSIGERINRYHVKDVFEGEEQELRTVVPIETIKLKTIIQLINSNQSTPTEEHLIT